MYTESQIDHSDKLGALYVRLLQGPLNSSTHNQLWDALLRNRGQVSEYFSKIGLDVVVDEEEGFSFLRQKDLQEGEEFPRLITRRPLPFYTSVLCALLRKKLLELDISQSGGRAVLDREEVYQMMSVFFPDTSNEKSLRAEINRHLSKAMEMGIIGDLPGQDEKLEIRRVIKAMISAEWLANLDQKLEQYREHGKLDA